MQFAFGVVILASCLVVTQCYQSTWEIQLETDINAKLTAWARLSHSEFANELYRFLNDKYDQRDWHVLVYNQIHGDDKHWVMWNEFRMFRSVGRRNLLVSSVDKNKTPIDIEWTHRLFRKTDSSHVGSYCFLNCNAKKVFYKYLYPYDNYFTAMGVIKKRANIAQKAPPSRLAYINNGEFMMYAFG